MHEKHKIANTTESSINETTTALERPEASPKKIQHDMESSTSEERDYEDTVYPTGLKPASIMISLYLATFLVALDRTIIATAIPQITDEFNSLSDIGWYASSYMMTSCAFQLFYGKLYVFYPTKWVFLLAILLFEVGSAICGAASSSVAFIWGRSIAGFGCSGIFSGGVVVMVHTIPLAKRPLFQGLFGAIFGIASVVGPLIGGAFTTHVTWRWCAVTVVIIALLLKVPPPEEAGKPLLFQLRQMDPIGTLVFIPGIVCLLLALQWGGSTYQWKDGRIVALLVLAGVLLLAFIAVQLWKGDSATVSPRIIKQRSIAAGFYWALCSGSAMMVIIYFLTTWFQAIEAVTAYESGIRLLPFVLSLVAGSIIGGAITWNAGYYTPPLILGTIIMSVGAGLLTTFSVNTSQPKWIGFQFIYGFGLGLGLQVPAMASQTVLSKRDVPIGASLMYFAQWLGGSVFVSVGQNLLSNKLVSGLKDIPGFSIVWVTDTGATNLRDVVPPESLAEVLQVYDTALVKVLDVAVALSCAGILGAVFMEWKSVKAQKGK
ncbi:Major facilitator superfamily domain, general substrate transporter [Penicillium occitanis (nom. inval.)]|nr:Major facilitator superfamily domain, general substrate transporter [Penicillium occitanis (nom. inval.)]PCG94701.1 hypothetical protein PENOC_081540 [Penicillium occitanis (nom. inval.)]